MADIVLLNAPIVFSRQKAKEGDNTSSPWIGILYLAAYLEKGGFEVKIYDPAAEKLSLSDTIKRLQKDKPFLVGVSTLTSGVRSSLQLANAVRQKFGKKIVLGIGGSHINVDPTFTQRYPIYDFSVTGDGEITLLKVARDIQKGNKLKKLYAGQPIENLDILPFPARHLINKDIYVPRLKEGSKEKQAVTIVGSRGCPFCCSFCSKSNESRKVRFRSAQNIVDEMESFYHDCDGKYSFSDDTLTLNRQLVIDMCRLIKERKLSVSWIGMTRVGCVDEKLIKLMAKSGCKELFFGVESGNARIRNEVIGKMVQDDEIRRAINWCRKYGITSSVFLMIGFPSETLKEIEDTINFGAKFKPDFIGVHITSLYPGSKIFKQAIEDKMIPKTLIDDYATGRLGKNFIKNWPIYIPKGLDLKALELARKRAYRRFYLNPGWIVLRFKSYFRTADNLRHDLMLVKTGVRVLLYGKTANTVT